MPTLLRIVNPSNSTGLQSGVTRHHDNIVNQKEREAEHARTCIEAATHRTHGERIGFSSILGEPMPILQPGFHSGSQERTRTATANTGTPTRILMHATKDTKWAGWVACLFLACASPRPYWFILWMLPYLFIIFSTVCRNGTKRCSTCTRNPYASLSVHTPGESNT